MAFDGVFQLSHSIWLRLLSPSIFRCPLFIPIIKNSNEDINRCCQFHRWKYSSREFYFNESVFLRRSSKTDKKLLYSLKILLCDSIHTKIQQFHVAILHKQPTAFRCEVRTDSLCVRSVSFKRKVHLNFQVVKTNEFGDLFSSST